MKQVQEVDGNLNFLKVKIYTIFKIKLEESSTLNEGLFRGF